MIIKDSNIYDLLKTIGRYWLPAITTLYVALAKVWGWEYTAEITATISAVTVCLNTLLGVSNENYSKEVNKEETDCEKEMLMDMVCSNAADICEEEPELSEMIQKEDGPIALGAGQDE